MSATPASVAYDAFAPFYDTLCRDQDFDWWWSEMLALAYASGLSPDDLEVLDVACGTGSSMRPLLRRGWQVTGIDNSAEMLAQARAKLDAAVPLHELDMRELPVLGSFDLICALNDSLNYLLDEQQLVDTFDGFERNLAPGGVVLFDVDTLGTFRASDYLVQQEHGRIVMSVCEPDPDFAPGATMREDFVVLVQQNGFCWSSERNGHLRRHHPDANLRAALAAAGLEVVSVHGLSGKTITSGFDDLRDEKAIYIARRR